jgi:hypothetical protein
MARTSAGGLENADGFGGCRIFAMRLGTGVDMAELCIHRFVGREFGSGRLADTDGACARMRCQIGGGGGRYVSAVFHVIVRVATMRRLADTGCSRFREFCVFGQRAMSRGMAVNLT